MRIALLFFVIFSTLNAQNNPPVDKKDPPTENAQDNPKKEPEKSAMDKEYYEYYFTTIPDAAKLKKEKLEFNLIRIFKSEINKRDYPACKELLPQINAKSIQYEKVTPESIWVRGIKNVLGYLPYTEYMYVVKFQKYFAFVSFELDPAKYVQAAYQMELIYKKDNIFDSKTESHPNDSK